MRLPRLHASAIIRPCLPRTRAGQRRAVQAVMLLCVLTLAVADTLLADPADPRRLDAHARAVGVSRRTLTRLFVHDTGMNFDRWRTHVRLRAALSLLAAGQPVSRVAHTVGYATASAFLAAFWRTVGTSPSRYLTGEALFGASNLSHGDSERTVAKERPADARPRWRLSAC